MRTKYLLLLLACIATGTLAHAADKLKVVATLPDLADIVRVIGGDRVEVSSICKGRENSHAVQAKPSHIVALSRADLFVEIGLSLETSFVPGLLEGARNPRIQPGAPGFVNCSEGWTALEVPSALSRKDGDVHPHGNPHMNLDPRGGAQIAQRVFEGLCRVDAASKTAYESRYGHYKKELNAASERWKVLAAAWKGRKIVVYHKEYDYLATACGFEIVGSLEVKPGIPPTPNHLAQLIEKMRAGRDVVILTAPWSNDRAVADVARHTGAKVVELPNMCGALSGTESWLSMMDLIHARLAAVFGAAVPAK